MSDQPTPSGSGGTVLPRRSPGHRGQDQRDTVAEMIQKAHEISLEAGSKMAGAMRDVIFAAAGLTPFAIESAKDLVNYMVRRGQMSAEAGNRIITEVENAPVRAVPKTGTPADARAAASKSAPAASSKGDAKPKAASAAKSAQKVASAKPATKPAGKPATPRTSAKKK